MSVCVIHICDSVNVCPTQVFPANRDTLTTSSQTTKGAWRPPRARVTATEIFIDVTPCRILPQKKTQNHYSLDSTVPQEVIHFSAIMVESERLCHHLRGPPPPHYSCCLLCREKSPEFKNVPCGQCANLVCSLGFRFE